MVWKDFWPWLYTNTMVSFLHSARLGQILGANVRQEGAFFFYLFRFSIPKSSSFSTSFGYLSITLKSPLFAIYIPIYLQTQISKKGGFLERKLWRWGGSLILGVLVPSGSLIKLSWQLQSSNPSSCSWGIEVFPKTARLGGSLNPLTAGGYSKLGATLEARGYTIFTRKVLS